jgi:two-component system, OmpR family, sensor kinase
MRLRTKISIVVFLAMFASFTATALAVIPVSKRLLIERIDRRMIDDAGRLRQGLVITPKSVTLVNGAAAGLRTNYSDYVIAVADRATDTVRLLATSGAASNPDPVPLFDTAKPWVTNGKVEFTQSVGRDLYRYTSIVLDDHWTLLIAVPTTDLGSMADSIVGLFVVFGLGSTLLVAGAGWWFIRRTTRPIEQLIERADHIASGDPNRRLMSSSRTKEIRQLSRALDAMMTNVDESLATRAAAVARLREFIGDASHELRTPLTSIHGYLQLDLDGALSNHDEHRRAIGRASSEAERMRRLIGAMQQLSEMDDEVYVARTSVDLVAIVRDGFHDAAEIDCTRSWQLDVPNVALIVEANEDELRQVVANVTANARQHTPPGTSVTLGLRDDGSNAVLTATDDGPGVSPEQAARVFDRFWRADPSRTRATGGSGLGLSIVASIVEHCRGTVSASAVEGRGFVLTVALPLVTDRPSA